MAMKPLTIQKTVLLTACLILFSVSTIPTNKAASKPMQPVFIFGDSTVDVGTNNHLKNCTARANHPYYGIDYLQSKPTGRFSNGQNAADTIVTLLGGYKHSPPPFLALLKNSSSFTGKILHGVNFASGGCGLDKETGKDPYGVVVSLEEQIQQFATVKGNITAILGESNGQLLLQGSMYIMSIGSNDIMSYIFTHPVTPELFIANLTATYAIHLKNLYSLGARKFGVISVPPIGCCPIARSFSPVGDCAKEPNDLAIAFYTPLESLLKNLSSTLEGFKYSLGNAYNMTMNIIEKPIGFKDVKTACCGNHTQQGISDCKKGGYVCPNRDEYLFWDAYHPSQAAVKLAARELVFGEDPKFVTPINFSTLKRA
ncbi:GDSL esterase/lipase At4g16230 [Lactuca sativa]|uniref:GDSL esterase/lipase At4g16230 n=1 Tax=Lactuca sativa TaxID=4236 RepID=UPI000CD8BC76|nr:GDSL esterase/lipase At4g16230 [Lactuca sativa]